MTFEKELPVMSDARPQVGFPEIVFGLPGTSKRMRNGPRQYVGLP